MLSAYGYYTWATTQAVRFYRRLYYDITSYRMEIVLKKKNHHRVCFTAFPPHVGDDNIISVSIVLFLLSLLTKSPVHTTAQPHYYYYDNHCARRYCFVGRPVCCRHPDTILYCFTVVYRNVPAVWSFKPSSESARKPISRLQQRESSSLLSRFTIPLYYYRSKQ